MSQERDRVQGALVALLNAAEEYSRDTASIPYVAVLVLEEAALKYARVVQAEEPVTEKVAAFVPEPEARVINLRESPTREQMAELAEILEAEIPKTKKVVVGVEPTARRTVTDWEAVARHLAWRAGRTEGESAAMLDTAVYHRQIDAPKKIVNVSTIVVLHSVTHKTLLLKRLKDPGAGCWCTPGGKIEWGETPEETAWRELWEELHLPAGECGPLRPLDTIVSLFPEHGMHCILHPFVVETDSPHVFTVVEPDEHSEVGWFDPERLPQPFIRDDDAVIRSALDVISAVHAL